MVKRIYMQKKVNWKESEGINNKKNGNRKLEKEKKKGKKIPLMNTNNY